MEKAPDNGIKYASSFKEQFTTRGMIIGALGSIILTTSSMFVALKISSLPWPIMFVALVSMFALKACGNTNINEINVCHTAMSAGSMIAGGLAFTLPGIWMLDNNASVPTVQLIMVSLGGTILGLIFTSLMRKYFVETEQLPLPMGTSAAEALVLGDQGGKKAITLFSSLGLSAVWTLLRDWFGVVPSLIPGGMVPSLLKYGSYGAIWASPMLISVGYLVGPLMCGGVLVGAIIGDFGVLVGGQSAGLWDAVVASNIKSSLGIGIMVGTGIGIFIKGILPNAKKIFGPMFQKGITGDSIVNLRWAPIVMVILAFLFTVICDMPILASIITILGAWLATAMSSQCVGMSGINPMEVFGIFILLIAKLVAPSMSSTSAFFVAAIVAVAAGICGDVMNDFKAGYILHSDPKAQWYSEVIGGLVGAFVAVGVLVIIVTAYGGDVFGSVTFPAAQAAAVSAMVGGISHVPAFIIGLIVGCALYCFNVSIVMTLGLGVYLPLYLSATFVLGGVLRLILDKCAKKWTEAGNGQIIAAGLLGGEGVMGVIIALIIAIQMIA